MIAASSIVFGRPERSSSARPDTPSARKRSRHLITVGRDTPTRRAAADVPSPSATANTIRARSTRLAGRVRERVQQTSSARSSALSTTAGDGIRHHPTLSTN
jgi:hypothetical protein